MHAVQSLQKRYIIGFEHVGLHDWTEVEFASPIPRFTSCLVCGSIASEMLWGRCWHVFCPLCTSIATNDGVLTCPLDGVQTAPDALHRDKVATEVLLAFRVFCPNRPLGCDYVGPMEKLREHIRICGFYNIQCQMCGSWLKRYQLREHASRTCALPDDSGALQQVKITVGQLYPDIPRIPQETGDRVTSSSRLAVIFNGNGQTYDVLSMVSAMKDMCREYEEFKNAFNLMRETLKLNIKEIKTEVDEATSKMTDQQERWKRDVLADVNLVRGMLRTRTYDWNIFPYSKLKKTVLKKKGLLKSEGFYIGYQGYYMAMSGGLSANMSDGKTYFNVYIHLLKGIFDSVLEWPYRKVTTVKLINQEPHGVDKVITLDPRTVCPDEMDSFERPRSERNIGYGFLMAPLDELEHSDNGFLKDDGFTVQMSVEFP